MSPFLQVVIVGVGTFALRLSLIAVLGRFELTDTVQRALRMVAPAVLGALVTQGVLLDSGGLRSFDSWHVAAVIATLVAWRSQSVTWTLLAGMGSLWVLQVVM